MKLLSAFSALLFAITANAQDSQPFTVVGRLEDISIDPNPTYNSGGRITVGFRNIIVPQNMKIDFPAAFVPFADLFNGTLLKDFPSPINNRYQAMVVGNSVNGVSIAGRIDIAENLGGEVPLGDGFIQSITYSNQVGGSSIQLRDGPRIRINDPNGRFTSGYTAYPFFTADDESPSITGFSGFPMCIPRVAPPLIDPLCPLANRPQGGTNRNFIAPQPRAMAPLAVGDFITYSGIRVGNEIIAYELTANVGIRTPPGTAPGYLAVELVLVGVLDQNPLFESADCRWLGTTSDSLAVVSIWAIDVDPCTGATSDRFLASAIPRTIGQDPRLRWEFRTDLDPVGAYTREYKFTLQSGEFVTAGGLTAGRYISPITDLVFPEVAFPGAAPPPNDFYDFPYLAQGSGPDDEGRLFGPLTPWPGAFPPDVVTDCGPGEIPDPDAVFTPVANAGPNISTRGGVQVTLPGTNTAPDIPAAALSYQWAQTSGPTITLSSSTVAAPTFLAPQLNGVVVRSFNFTITPTNGPTSSSSVTVTTDSNALDIVKIDSYTWTSGQSGTISVAASTNVVDGTANSMIISVGGAGFVAMLVAGPGRFSYTQRSVDQNTPITVSSIYGGEASVGVPAPTLAKSQSAQRIAPAPGYRRRAFPGRFETAAQVISE